MSQWVNVPPGASGSSTTNARLAVPAGGPAHCSGGEWSPPSHVYIRGIACPAANAELISPRSVPVFGVKFTPDPHPLRASATRLLSRSFRPPLQHPRITTLSARLLTANG